MSTKYRESRKKDDDQIAKARSCEADFSKSPSMTSQSPAEEVDINKIMARVHKGQTILAPDGQPFYGDVSELGGLQESFIKVQEADELFMQYPAELREKFDNDPVNLITFLEDPKNMEEAIKLGLVNKPIPVPEPEKPAPAPAPAGGPTQYLS